MNQSEQSRQGSRLGWYLLGCFALLLVLAAACVVGGLLAGSFRAGGVGGPSSPPLPAATQPLVTVTP
jgi:hypothetical protein